MESPLLQARNEEPAPEFVNKESDCDKSGADSKNLEQTYTTVTQIEIAEVSSDSKEIDTDIVILRRDPTTKRNLINKSAYAKLHRTLSPGRNTNTIDTIKEKYETNTKPDLIDVKGAGTTNGEVSDSEQTPNPPTKLDEKTLQTLKTKYSPASFGYPKNPTKNSKLPVPKTRSAVKSQIILPSTRHSDKDKTRYSLNVDKKSKSKDENSNEVHRKNSSSSGEFVTIVTRSESEGSVDKLEKELNLFTMDAKPKEKKRANSFRKIFSGKIFGKDKKKKEEEKEKTHFRENVAYVDNLQNETNSFNRQANYRHTVGGNSNIRPKETRQVTRSDSDRYSNHQQNQYITKEMEEKYAQMHVNQFNHIKQAFEHPNSVTVVQQTEGYVRMDKPIVKNNPGPTNYMNLPNVKRYIDTSSSASTLESDRSNNQREFVQINQNQDPRKEQIRNENFNSLKSVRFESNKESRDTPPRAQELRTDVRLVNPKALIPINSERPLPNPYQNSNNSTLEKTRPRLEETYGTVLDSIDFKNRVTQQPMTKTNELKINQKPPRSPSFEPSKLKLPPNREIVPLSPRVKSPIPHDNVSAEKIIATELLKSSRSPTPTRKGYVKMTNPSHQKLEMDIDYPDNVNNERHENRTMERNFPAVTSKPPISRLRKSPEASSSSANSLTRQSNSQTSLIYNDNKRLSQASPASENLENSYGRYRRSQVSPVVDNQERITTNAMVHVNANNIRSATPNNLLHNRSLSPVTPQSIRSSTPVEFRLSPSAKSSPQKEDMRKSVEAYYWKELKKLKEQENFDMYLYQLQMMPYGYAEDPISVRRSRSLSPTSHRNSRRSLSLPRDPRPHNLPQDIPEMYGRIQPAPIPEGRAVVNQPPQRNVMYGQLQQYQPNFRRNTPERRTIDGAPRIVDNNYRPIFKRGSLTTPVKELEDAQNKKVSFSSSDSQKLQSWPTRNGFTQSPPQRRVDSTRISSVEDDVFLPNTPRTPNRYEVNEIYGYVNKPNVWYDYGPNPNEVVYYTRQNVEVKNSEPLYDRNPNNVRYVVNYPIEESAYGQPVDAVVRPPYRLTRHGSIQLPEPVYDQRQINSRRRSFENGQVRPVPEPQYVTRQAVPPQNQVNMRYGIKREIILNDEIFGQFGGYVQPGTLQNRQNPVYSSKQSIAEPLYGRTGPKQVSVRNKVCDIYGQIHDPAGTPTVGTPTQIRRTGVLMGQLQTSPGSPQPLRQPLTNDQFLRNTRLTASANDMYRRYQNVDPRYRSDVVYDGTRYQQQQETVAPNRPLPPVPMKKGLTRNHTARSDTDSDASEMHKVNNSGAKNKKRGFFEEEWNAEGKSGRGISGSDSGRSDNEGGEVRGRSRNTRRDDPRRHTLGADQQYLAMAGQGGPLSRTMDLEGQPRGYPPPSNAMLFDDDPGIMSEVETSSTGFRRGGKQRSSLPVVRTPSKTLERPLGLVFLQYRNETKRALLPNEITSIDTVKALFVRSFPKQLTMEYLDSPNVKIYIHDSSKDMFYELEDLRSHLREIRDRSVLRLFESADVSGGLPMAGIGIAGGVGHFEDPSYFSEPEFDSEYQHQHIHKSKGSAGKSAPYYMGSTTSLPRGATLLRTYSPAVAAISVDRMKPLPTDGYMSSPERGSRYEDPYYSQYATRSGSITPVIDEEISDTELLDESYSLYGVKLPSGGGPRGAPRSPFPPTSVSVPPYDATRWCSINVNHSRLRVENMERQLANLTGLVQKALTQPAATHLQVPGRESYRDKSVSFEKSVSFSDEPPDMNSPKQHSPQHAADTKPAKPAIKSSTLPRTSSQERDRLKPAPPPKPASLSPGQYDSRIYRDLQLTPEMYNQLRGLQKKAKDLRAEVRNLRRMSQAQAHSVKETIRDTFIKIRAMLLAGGEQVWQAGMDQERVRLTREEDLYKQEMLRLETDLSDLEATVEELRGNVINRKTRVNMSDVENMALVLSKSSKTVADLKLRFPGLQDGMKTFLSTEMEKVMREEKFLKEEPERLESALRRCKKLTGTLVTLKRLASVQEQRLPCSNSNDGRLSPTSTDTPPVTPSSTHSKVGLLNGYMVIV